VINDYYFSEKIGESLVAGCIPVYYGCTSIEEHIPPEFYVDMRDFRGADGMPDIDRTVEHCLRPGVYEEHRRAVGAQALPFLTRCLTTEKCLIDPLQAYIDELRQQRWRSQRRSMAHRYWACRRWARHLLSRS
jgi:hypothetical protein